MKENNRITKALAIYCNDVDMFVAEINRLEHKQQRKNNHKRKLKYSEKYPNGVNIVY